MSLAQQDRFLDTDRFTQCMLTVGAFMFAMLIVTGPAAIVETRTLNGINVWIKPLKFDLSLMVHAFTIAVLAQQLPRKARDGIVVKAAGFLFVVAIAFESIYVNIQAMRGRASHFNYETVLEQTMYALMGLGALLLVLLPFVVGLVLLFQRDGDKSGYRLGTVMGLLIAPVLTVIYGGYMSMSGSHFVNAPGESDAGGFFLLGWSTRVGDLRPAHFFALHAMQFLPLLGVLADRIVSVAARPIVLVGAVANGALATWLFFNALAGRPFWPF